MTKKENDGLVLQRVKVIKKHDHTTTSFRYCHVSMSTHNITLLVLDTFSVKNLGCGVVSISTAAVLTITSACFPKSKRRIRFLTETGPKGKGKLFKIFKN